MYKANSPVPKKKKTRENKLELEKKNGRRGIKSNVQTSWSRCFIIKWRPEGTPRVMMGRQMEPGSVIKWWLDAPSVREMITAGIGASRTHRYCQLLSNNSSSNLCGRWRRKDQTVLHQNHYSNVQFFLRENWMNGHNFCKSVFVKEINRITV